MRSVPETSPPGGPDQSEVAEPAPLPPSFARTSLSLLADQTHVNLLGNVHGGEVPTEARRQREAEIRRAHRLAQRAEIEQGRRSPGVP